MVGFSYDDIININYPNPEIELDFPDEILREAQFAPFSALTGYEDVVKETARYTDCKAEIDDYVKEQINAILQYIINSEKNEFVTITYFVPDEIKSGGVYVTKTGTIEKVREFERNICMEDGTEILIDDIFSIELVQAEYDEGI